MYGFGVPVIKDALHHTGIEQQSLNLIPSVGTSRIGNFPIDVKRIVNDAHCCLHFFLLHIRRNEITVSSGRVL